MIFTEEADSRTRVELAHRNLQRYGDDTEQMRAIFDHPDGWTGTWPGSPAWPRPSPSDTPEAAMALRRQRCVDHGDGVRRTARLPPSARRHVAAAMGSAESLRSLERERRCRACSELRRTRSRSAAAAFRKRLVCAEPGERHRRRGILLALTGTTHRVDARMYSTAWSHRRFRRNDRIGRRLIHQQDIRRPLGIARRIPEQRLRAVLDFALTVPAVRGARRTRGVRLLADDLDWTHGDGPEVRGPGGALLMAMAARPDVLKDLTGSGKPLWRNVSAAKGGGKQKRPS